MKNYFEMARSSRIATSHIKKPRERCLLNTLSGQCNLTKPCSVLNLDKSIGRCSLRQDGIVPCLGYGCTGCYLPAAGTFLTIPQLLKLTGLSEDLPDNLFKDACTLIKKTDIDVMIGNAMTLPVVNALITATMGITTSDPF